MRIVHFVAGNLDRGAARGAWTLHRALRDLGVESVLITNGYLALSSPDVVSLSPSRLLSFCHANLRKIGNLPMLLYPKRQDIIFNTGFTGAKFTNLAAYTNADIVHLHWINGLISSPSLRLIEKPVVWTLRDMWPITGGCHYSLGCHRYKVGCGACPQLASSREQDLSRIVFTTKYRSLPRHLTIVGTSTWITDCATQSLTFKNREIRTIFNSVDTDLFFPVDKLQARLSLKISTIKPLVLIGAQRLEDHFKGFDLFIASLKHLDPSACHLLIFGSGSVESVANCGFTYTNFGFVDDPSILRDIYSAADVFVAPSRAEAFGKTIIEAMACGTPVVSFDSGGPKDIITHGLTGFLAQSFDPQDLAILIQTMLNLPMSSRQQMQINCINKVTSFFASTMIAKQYIELYRAVLGNYLNRTNATSSSKKN